MRSTPNVLLLRHFRCVVSRLLLRHFDYITQGG
jgi:hypothetical protein